jgi:hypothetical protein
MIIIFAVATPILKVGPKIERKSGLSDGRSDVGPRFASVKLSDRRNHGPNDGHTEPRTTTRTYCVNRVLDAIIRNVNLTVIDTNVRMTNRTAMRVV